jgi:uncharacterized repeat protein (TIGR01451 family)
MLTKNITVVLLILMGMLLSTTLKSQWIECTTPENIDIFGIKFHGNKFFCFQNKELYESYDTKTWNKNSLSLPLIPASNYTLVLKSSSDKLIIYDSESPEFIGFSIDTGQTWETFSCIGQGFTKIKDILVTDNFIILASNNQLFRSTDKGQNWQLVKNQTTGFSTQSLTETSTGIVAVSTDSIFRSTNDGMNWIATPTHYQHPIYHTNATIYNDGVALLLEYRPENFYNSKKIVHSLDQGVTWDTLTFDLKKFHLSAVSDFFFAKNDTLTAISTDHGVTWSYLLGIPNITSITKGNGIWIGKSSYSGIFRSTNFEDWQSLSTNLKQYRDWLFVNFYTDNDKIALSVNNNLYLTGDSGINWDYFTTNTYTPAFYSSGDTVISIDNYKTFRSFDKGKTWETFATDFDCRKIFKSGQFLFAIKSNNSFGNLFRSDNLGETWVPIYSVPSPNPNESFVSWSYNKNRIIGTTLNYIYESYDGGLTFTPLNQGINLGGIVNAAWATNDETVFATIEKKMYRYSNNIWQPVTYGLTNLNGYSYILHKEVKKSGDFAFTHGDNDIWNDTTGYKGFYSTDGGVHWNKVGERLPIRILVKSEIYQDRVYIVGNDENGKFKMFYMPIADFNFKQYAGNVFNDANNNGLNDPNEVGLRNVKIKLKSSQYLTTSKENGLFSFNGPANQDTLEAIPPHYASISTNPVILNNSLSNIQLGIHFTPNVRDLKVSLTLLSPNRPGFENELNITVKNVGTANADGWLKFSIPSGIQINFATPSAQISGDSIFWNINGLAQNAILNFKVNFNVLTSTQIGEIIDFYAKVGDLTNDLDLSNNEFVIKESTVGSFDPNEKYCDKDKITPEMVQYGERLFYTIRFQNTGNYPATFVRIIDTLTNGLDPSSIEILASSHAYTWTLKRENIVDLLFENINLPDSMQNEMGSHGFIQFSIKLKNGLHLGDNVQNKAYIYFDFNEPVITNATNTEITNDVKVLDAYKFGFKFEIFPNPSKNFINLSFENITSTVPILLTIQDVNGKIVLQKPLNTFENSISLNVTDFQLGIHTISLKKDGIITSKKWVKL